MAYVGPQLLQGTLSRFAWFERATEISFSGPMFCDSSMPPIAQLPHLSSVSFSETGVSQQWIEKFEASRPNCLVLHPIADAANSD